MSENRYRKMIREAKASPHYWRGVVLAEFLEDLAARMEQLGLKRADLARRMGKSRAHVTKVLNSTNMTLQTMIDLSMAVEGTLHVHVAGRNAVTHWFDEYRNDAIGKVNLGMDPLSMSAPGPIYRSDATTACKEAVSW